MTDPEGLLGKQLNEFVLDEYIARGAMGLVYKATDTKMDRSVALKLVSKSVDLAPAMAEARKRLQSEAKAAGRLTHPNIVTVHGWGETEEFLYICMEYVPGRSLSEILREKKVLRPDEAIPLFKQILQALAVAAEERIVHRDIKPSNIMVTRDNRVKVMDFGIAKMPSMHLTVTGIVLGTPFYMSPEQISGQEVDARSDLFSLGAVLYQSLTGKMPFEGENTVTLTYKIMNIEPIPPREFNSRISESLERICLTALVKDPTLRYQTPGEMLEALEEVERESAMPAQQTDMDATIVLKPVLAGKPPGTPLSEVKAPRMGESTPRVRPRAEPAAPEVKHGGTGRPLKRSVIASAAALIIVGGGVAVVRQFMHPSVQPARTSQPAQQPEISVADLISQAKTLMESDPSRARKLLEDAIVREPDNGEAFLELAKLLDKSGEFQAAIGQYKNALRFNSKDSTAWFRLGSIYLGLADYDHALESFESCVALSPSNRDEVLTDMGLAWSKKNDPARAADLFKQAFHLNSGNQVARKSFKDSVSTLVSLGKKQSRQNPADAQKLLEKALTLAPDNYEASVALAALQKGRNDYRAAIAQYRNALRINSGDAGVWFRLGSSYLAVGDYDHALESFKSCLALSPSNRDEVLTDMGLAWSKKSDPARASDLFKAALGSNPSNQTAQKALEASVSSLVSLAKKTSRQNPADARKMLEKAVALAPGSYEAAVALAAFLDERKDYRAAIVQYENALRINGKDAPPWFRLGSLYLDAGDYDHALESLKTCLALSPSNRDEVLTDMGLARSKKNDPAGAADLFRQALDFNPGNQAARNGLTLSVSMLVSLGKKLSLKNPDDAQKMLEKAVALAPGSYEASSALASFLDGKKDYRAAIVQYNNALRANNRDETAWFRLGSIYLSTGDYDHALESFKSCLILSPSNRDEVLTDMGLAYSKKNDVVKARAFFKEALDVNGRNEVARRMLDESIALMVKEAEAKSQTAPKNAADILKRAIALDPGNFEANFQMGRVLTFLKDYDNAIRQYHKALSIKKDFPDIYFNLGYIYLVKGNFDLAIQNFESCRKLSPSYLEEVLTNLGISYYNKENSELAEKCFKEALKLNPGNSTAKKYLASLER